MLEAVRINKELVRRDVPQAPDYSVLVFKRQVHHHFVRDNVFALESGQVHNRGQDRIIEVVPVEADRLCCRREVVKHQLADEVVAGHGNVERKSVLVADSDGLPFAQL